MLSSPSKKGHWMLIYPEKIVLETIIQNLLNLRMNYTRRFLHMSPLSNSSYTVYLFGKLVKRKFQEEVIPMFDIVCEVTQ
jgi:hypothetical protein